MIMAKTLGEPSFLIASTRRFLVLRNLVYDVNNVFFRKSGIFIDGFKGFFDILNYPAHISRTFTCKFLTKSALRSFYGIEGLGRSNLPNKTIDLVTFF